MPSAAWSRRRATIFENDRCRGPMRIERVTSTRNQYAVLLRKLASKKHRTREGLTLVEGTRVLETALDAGVSFALLMAEASFLEDPETSKLTERLDEGGAMVFEATADVVGSVASVASPQGFVAAARIPEIPLGDVLDRPLARGESARRLFLVADAVSDPGNLGVLIRTAAALGASGYVTTTGTVDAFSPRTIRASAGSVFPLPGAEGVPGSSVVEELRLRGYSIVASSPAAEVDLQCYETPGRVALVVGEEASGLSSRMLEAADVTLRIPMVEGAESLNVGSAAAILLHTFSPLRPGAEG